MRMWKTNPRYLCREHLIGVHGELHKHRHNFVKKHRMHNRIYKRQIDAYAMQQVHDDVAYEMTRRGYKHNSPYEQPDVSYLPRLAGELECATNKCEKCLERMVK